MHNIMYVDITMFCVFLVQFGWSVERVLVLFFFSLYGDHRDLHVLTHSFPTRRSSDLDARNTTPQGVVSSTTLIAYPTNAVTSLPAFATAVAPVVPSAENRSINSNYFTNAEDKNYGLSAQLDWHIGDYKLTSITAWRGWKNDQAQDQKRDRKRDV